jgi:uncharacterized protein YbjT (DUF2867 family)
VFLHRVLHAAAGRLAESGRRPATTVTTTTPSPALACGRRVALVAGASGLVGTALLPLLCLSPATGAVLALTRRPLAFADRKLHVVPAAFGRLDVALGPVLDGLPRPARIDVFCCLGTTLRAAGSQAAFRQVDHDYVLALARWARQAGAASFVLVSALGADPASRMLYTRVKGETESGVLALGLRHVVILRPSLLDGPRSRWRTWERLALAVTRPWRGLLPAGIRPVSVADVAAAMWLSVDGAEEPRGVDVLDSAALQGAAARLQRSQASIGG